MSHIKIDKTKCKSCYLCIDACPFKLIKISEEVGKTGEKVVEFCDEEKKCIACKSCAVVCPDIAIVGVYK